MSCTIRQSLLFMSLVMSSAAGCSFTGTTEAIFDATSDVTVSTSGRIWWTEDGLVKSDYKAQAFAVYNRRHVEQDLARGHGEYLAALSELLGVEENRRAAFIAAAQQQFESIAPQDRMIAVARLRSLVD